MAETGADRGKRLIDEHDKDKDKKLDPVELATAKEMEVLEGDVEDVRALADLERLAKVEAQARSKEDRRRAANAKKAAKEQASEERWEHLKKGVKAGAVGTAVVGVTSVGILWRLSKPFRWAAGKLHDWGKRKLQENDELGIIEGTEDWLVEKEKK